MLYLRFVTYTEVYMFVIVESYPADALSNCPSVSNCATLKVEPIFMFDAKLLSYIDTRLNWFVRMCSVMV
jgi:hypothetical protein